MNIEYGIFTPLIFSVSWGMGKECSMFHKHIAERLAIKTGESYEKIISTNGVISIPQISLDVCEKTIDEFELVSYLARRNRYVSSGASFHII